MLSKFEDLVSLEEEKLPALIRMTTRMQFIKYRQNFYISLQERNMDSFEKLTDLYATKLVQLSQGGKLRISNDDLQKMVIETQAAFDEMAAINFQEISTQYLDEVRREVVNKYHPVSNISIY